MGTPVRGAIPMGAALSVVVLHSLGCEVGRVGAQRMSVVDSSGVILVQLAEFEELESLDLGLDPGWKPTPSHEFADLADVLPLAHGRVAVLDALAPTLTVFSEDGATLTRFGQEGQGPGELNPSGLRDLVATDSSLLVPDLFQQRINEYSLDGEFLVAHPFPGSGGLALEWRAHDGRGVAFRMLGAQGDHLLRGIGAAADTLHVFNSHAIPPNALLADAPLWDIRDGKVALGWSHRGEIEVREEGTKRLLARIRGPEEEAPFTAKDRSALEELLFNSMERDAGGGELPAARRATILEQMTFPANKPIFSAVRLMPSNQVWIRLARRVRDMDREALRVGSADGFGGRQWVIVDLDGAESWVVRLPAAFSPTAFGDDWIYGVSADELGREQPARVRRSSVDPRSN